MPDRRRAVLGLVLVAVLGSACSPPEPSLDVGLREVPTDVVIGTRAIGSPSPATAPAPAATAPPATTAPAPVGVVTTTTSTLPSPVPGAPPPVPAP